MGKHLCYGCSQWELCDVRTYLKGLERLVREAFGGYVEFAVHKCRFYEGGSNE